jgi:acyl-CoA reductase-like NAD-dependent aldehyde dehydrogenase
MQSDPSPRSTRQRIQLIAHLAGQLAARSTPLAELIANEVGKPLRFSVTEVHRTETMIRASLARHATQSYDQPAGPARLRRRPIGTVAVITPANNPIYIPLSKMIPAVLYGNSVIFKPALEATRVAQQLMNTLALAGWPDDLVQCRMGGNDEAERLMNDPHVSAVTITGSESAGQTARTICSRRNIPLQAELGGNNAAIVWSDADLPSAAQSIAAGAFEMAGQRCTANRRVIVHQECRNAFLQLLQSACQTLSWGDPLSLATQIGPLTTPARCQRVATTVQQAKSFAQILHPLGTESPITPRFPGCWYPPTIVHCDDPSAQIVQEETFGPVLVVQTATNWQHALELCNGVRQGLVAAIFSRSRPLIRDFLEHAEAGILKVNQSTADAAIDIPFCAWKGSGTGLPEHGIFNREFYTRPQTVYEAA